MKKIAIFAIPFLIMAVIAFALKSDSPSTQTSTDKLRSDLSILASQSEPFNVLVFLPRTGNYASKSIEIKNAFELAATELNDSTNFDGDIRLDYVESRCSNNENTAILNKKTDINKYNAIIGGICEADSISLNNISKDNKIAFVNLGRPTAEMVKDNIFGVHMKLQREVENQALADLAFKRKIKKNAIISDDNQGLNKSAQVFADDFRLLGGEVILENLATNLASGQIELSDKILKLKKSGVNAVYLNVSEITDAVGVVDSMKKIRWFVPLLLNSELAQAVEGLGSKSAPFEGALSVTSAQSGQAQLQDIFKQRYYGKFNKNIIYDADVLSAYDAFYFLADGLQSVGPKSLSFIDWARSIKTWVGLLGPLVLDTNATRIIYLAPASIKKGKLQLLDN